LIVLMVFITICLCAQNVTLLYKEKEFLSKEKVLSISFCDQQGNVPVSEEEFAKSDKLYFAYKPIGDWEFKEKDIDEGVAMVYIMQEGDKIHQQELKTQTFEGKISQIIAAFPKHEFELAESFSFHNELSKSPPMIFPEKFWPAIRTIHITTHWEHNFMMKRNFWNPFRP